MSVWLTHEEERGGTIWHGSSGAEPGHTLHLLPNRNEHGEYERRKILVAIVECEHCGGDVDLWADTDGWVMDDPRGQVWTHTSYGPAMGACACSEDLYASDMDGRLRRWSK